MSMTIEAEQEKHRKIRPGQRVRKKCGVELIATKRGKSRRN